MVSAMSAPEPQPQRVARPEPGGERGWMSLVLDHLPLPALIIDTATARVVVRNPAASHIPPESPARITIGGDGLDEPGELLPRLVSAAATGDGVAITWQTPQKKEHYRAYLRALPPADGNAPLALLTFVDDGRAAAERELRAVIETRDEFFSVATHELKDPLFSIQLSLQLLRHAAAKHGPVPAHVAHHLDVAGRQADRLARIIDNLLDVSRIRSGRLQLDAEALDFAELTREVASRFQEPARAAGTTLTADAPDPVIGYFDRLKID